jgi:hypothetical protein
MLLILVGAVKCATSVENLLALLHVNTRYNWYSASVAALRIQKSYLRHHCQNPPNFITLQQTYSIDQLQVRLGCNSYNSGVQFKSLIILEALFMLQCTPSAAVSDFRRL